MQVTSEGRSALEARARFDDPLLRFPLHAEGEVPSDISWHALLQSSDTLRGLVDEAARACLCCSSLDGKKHYAEKKAREVLIALVCRVKDVSIFMRAVHREYMLMRLDGGEWKPFHRLNVRLPTNLIASTWGIVAFSSIRSGPPGLCIADPSWESLQGPSFAGPEQSACCISGKILQCGQREDSGDEMDEPPEFECVWKAPEGKHPGWQPRPPDLRRANHSCATIGGLAYVVGGFDFDGREDEILATVDVYDPRTDRWDLMPHSMNEGRAECGIAGCHGMLFVFGGVCPGPEGEGARMLSSCEFLAKDSPRGWVRIPDAPAAGRCAAVAVRSQEDRGRCLIYAVFESSPVTLWQYVHQSAEWLDCSFMALPPNVGAIQALCVAPEVAHWECRPPLADSAEDPD